MGLCDTPMDQELGEQNADVAYKTSEAYRHLCEVQSVVRMFHKYGGDRVKSYLYKVEEKRGSDAASRLREEALAQVRLGKTKQQR